MIVLDFESTLKSASHVIARSVLLEKLSSKLDKTFDRFSCVLIDLRMSSSDFSNTNITGKCI